jgi:hypothetical protein
MFIISFFFFFNKKVNFMKRKNKIKSIIIKKIAFSIIPKKIIIR